MLSSQQLGTNIANSSIGTSISCENYLNASISELVFGSPINLSGEIFQESNGNISEKEKFRSIGQTPDLLSIKE